jgi:hypothetical protein
MTHQHLEAWQAFQGLYGRHQFSPNTHDKLDMSVSHRAINVQLHWSHSLLLLC